MRRIIPLLAGATAVVAWGLAGIGGAPADCIPACDCETIGGGPIRQPAAAWSALAIVAAGVWAARSRGRSAWVGAGIAASGLAAFAAHASVAGWAYDLDGAGVALVAWLVAASERWSPAVAVPAAAAAAALALWAGPPASGCVAGMGVAAFAAFRIRGGRWRPLVPAAAVLAAGAMVRALTDDGGPWCMPDSPITGHAAWHLMAAAGLALMAAALEARTAEAGSPPGALRSGAVRSHDDP